MYLPELRVPPVTRYHTDRFKGLNSGERIAEGEFNSLINCTGDHFPVLSVREPRHLILPKNGTVRKLENCIGFARKNTLVYVDVQTENGVTAGHLYYNGNDTYDPVSFSLSPDTEKQIVSMGAYLIVFPDMKYLNTRHPNTDKGSINISNSSSAAVRVSLCTQAGKDYQKTNSSAARYVTVSSSQPSNPSDGARWLDTSESPPVMKKWSEASGAWAELTTYIKIAFTGAGTGLESGDVIELTVPSSADQSTASLAGTRELVRVTGDSVCFEGSINDTEKSFPAGKVFTVKREAPEMDFVIECANRLWGCKHGRTASGKVVNEIYASKLGDFRNWKSFSGLSTDSWAASVGSDGAFTGACSFRDHPLFFKEECLHKIYISPEGAHQIITGDCHGVQAGSERSLADSDGVLYYKSVDGIYTYDGGGFSKISDALGNAGYTEAVAAVKGQKYCVSMKNGEGRSHLFLYDIAKRFWYREENPDFYATSYAEIKYMAEKDGDIFYVDTDDYMWSFDGKGSTTVYDTTFREEVEWEAETGWFGYELPDKKYITRLSVNMSVPIGSYAIVYLICDDILNDDRVTTVYGTSEGSTTVDLVAGRCERMKLRLRGAGRCELFSVTKTVERGSDA